MAARRPDHARRYPVLYRALAGFIVASAAFAAVFVALTLSAFHAPRPHGLPVGVVGPAAVTSRVEHALDGATPGAFGWRSYSSEAGARTGIAQREVDGALVASGHSLRLLVAQGGGTGPAQVLTQAFGVVAARSGHHLVVADVVPPLPGDTEALSSFFVVLGVLIPSLAAGSGSALAFRRARPALAVAAPVAGAARPITLVVGFDNSQPARRALIWSADLLRGRPGTLHVIYADHVVIDSDLSGFAHTEMEDARDDKAARVAEAAAEIAAAAGVPYTFERRQGPPADAILSTANIRDAAEPASTPVIVTGRSHHAAHRVIGSVPVQLLHQSPYPVLTI